MSSPPLALGLGDLGLPHSFLYPHAYPLSFHPRAVCFPEVVALPCLMSLQLFALCSSVALAMKLLPGATAWHTISAGGPVPGR